MTPQELLPIFEKYIAKSVARFVAVGRVAPSKDVYFFTHEGQRYEAAYTPKKVKFTLISKYGRSVKYGTPTEYVLGSITR